MKVSKYNLIKFILNNVPGGTTSSLDSLDVAEVVHFMYRKDFVYKHDSWYRFVNYCWVEYDVESFLHEKLATEVAKKYIEFAIDNSSKAVACVSDANMHAKYYEKTKGFLDTAMKLKDIKEFREIILRDCQRLFCIRDDYCEWFRSMSRIFNHKIPEQIIRGLMAKNIPELQDMCQAELDKIKARETAALAALDKYNTWIERRDAGNRRIRSILMYEKARAQLENKSLNKV